MIKLNVARILFLPKDSLKAIGIENLEDNKFFAYAEIVLLANILNSLKLLLLSGIGPDSKIKKHFIPVYLNLLVVGRNLKDHYYIILT